MFVLQSVDIRGKKLRVWFESHSWFMFLFVVVADVCFFFFMHHCSVVLTKKPEEEEELQSEGGQRRWGGEIFSTSQQGVWRGWRAGSWFCAFCHISSGSFYSKRRLARAQTHKGKKLLHPRSVLAHSHAHCTAGPSRPRPLSSQRHRDIFIFHKAQTLMKHRRHKYISMIYFFKSGS